MPAPYIMYTKYTTSHEFKWSIFSFALGDLNVTEASLIIVWWPLRGLWCSSGIPPLLCCNSKRIPSNFQSNHKNKVLAFQNELCWMRFKLRMIERFPHWAEADVRAEVSERLKAQSSSLPCMPSQGGGWFVEGGGRAGNVTVGFVLLHSRRIAATSWHSHGELVSSFSLISCFPAELAHQLFPDQLLLCTRDSTQVFLKIDLAIEYWTNSDCLLVFIQVPNKETPIFALVL